MQLLKFLGRGSAFNVEEGNTSAYFIKDNIFFLLDCGETIFYELKSNNKLQNLIKEHNIKDVHVYITHLHTDHTGSLSSLIYYCYYVLGIKVNVHYPDIAKLGDNPFMMTLLYNSPLIITDVTFTFGSKCGVLSPIKYGTFLAEIAFCKYLK